MNWHRFKDELPLLLWDEFSDIKTSAFLLLYSSKFETIEFGIMIEYTESSEFKLIISSDNINLYNLEHFDYWCYQDDIPKPSLL